MGPPGTPTAWTTYLATENADATAEKVTAAGGKLISEPFDVMDAGRMAVAADPAGAVFGIWQSRRHTGVAAGQRAGLADLEREHEPRTWTPARPSTRPCSASATATCPGDFRYATLDLHGGMVGGIGDWRRGGPARRTGARTSRWPTPTPPVARAADLGGRVISPASDTPYGRMATVSDDQGAVFSVMSSPAGQG